MNKINTNRIEDVDAIRALRQSAAERVGTLKTDSLKAEPKFDQDKLEVSERAAKVGKLIEEIREMPDVREAKTADLRKRIESGEYEPTGADIADAILRDER